MIIRIDPNDKTDLDLEKDMSALSIVFYKVPNISLLQNTPLIYKPLINEPLDCESFYITSDLLPDDEDDIDEESINDFVNLGFRMRMQTLIGYDKKADETYSTEIVFITLYTAGYTFIYDMEAKWREMLFTYLTKERSLKNQKIGQDPALSEILAISSDPDKKKKFYEGNILERILITMKYMQISYYMERKAENIENGIIISLDSGS